MIYLTRRYLILLLENENTQLQDQVGTLTDIIVNMQVCLNKTDGMERNNNIIVSGLSEEDIPVLNEGEPDLILADDIGKIKTLLTKLCLAGFDVHILDRCSINRIGKQRSNYKRLIKVVLPTVALRNVILDNAKKLKTFTDPWKYIYIKKDLHPVYLK